MSASRGLAAPEWHHGRRSFGRMNENTIGVDTIDAPGIGPQEEGVIDAAFVNEFLIHLADAEAFVRVNRVLAGVRNRSAVNDGQALTAGQGLQTLMGAI